MLEDLFRPQYGIEGVKAGVVPDDGRLRHPEGDEGFLHRGRLIVTGVAIVSADQEVAAFPRVVETGRRFHTGGEVEVGPTACDFGGTAEDEGNRYRRTRVVIVE